MRDLQLPTVLSNGVYTLTSLVGSGGMGSIFRAEVDLERFDYISLLAHASASRRVRRNNVQNAFRMTRAIEFRAECEQRSIPVPARTVAIKVVRVDGQDEKRFRDEWLSLIGVRHPNLIEVYAGGVDADQGLGYYVMELLEDVLSLDEVMALPLETRLRLGAEAAAGLAELHEMGLLHRDVKPGNVVCYREDGAVRVKIVDLGIAKDVDRSHSLTGTRDFLGTPHYLPPEMLEGGKHVTARCDIYGLGATLYHWVCGRPPHVSQHLYGVLARLASRMRAEPARRSVPSLPIEIDRLLSEMLSPEPVDRPASMEQVAEALDASAEELACRNTALRVLPAPMPSGEAGRALVADPGSRSRKRLITLLEKEGFVVDVCKDGASALLQTGLYRYDLLVMEQQLPCLSGLKVMDVLREQSIEIPAILCTAAFEFDPSLLERSIGVGVAPLAKPFVDEDLSQLIKAVMPTQNIARAS